MAIVSWIHLSDWHQKGPDFDRSIVRDALITDIRGRRNISEELERVDFVFFTGDLSFSGKLEELLTAEREFLNPILEACGIGYDRLFIVPGNHDVARDLVGMINLKLNDFATGGRLAGALLQRHTRDLCLYPLTHFSEFLARDRTKPLGFNTVFACRKYLDLGPTKIALIGLNSSWMCGRRENTGGEIDDYGQLLVGEPQLEEALRELERADLTIGMLHHPFGWLAQQNGIGDREQVKRRLLTTCDVVLHGHEHLPSVVMQSSTAGASVVVPAGASFARRENPQMHANGYNYCVVDLASERGIVYMRRFDGDRHWIPDIATTGEEAGGAFEFSLPKKSNNRRKKEPLVVSPATPTIDDAVRITSADPNSVREINAEILNESEGGISVCLYVQEFGEGVRRLVNNRHILGHVLEAKSPYKGVFSFHRGPLAYAADGKDQPTWKLWLTSDDGSQSKSWSYPDVEQVAVGWHNFVVRWKHSKPLLEVLLDGRSIIQALDYERFWPRKILSRMVVGCWPNKWKEHYIETWIAKVRTSRQSFDSAQLADWATECKTLTNPNE